MVDLVINRILATQNFQMKQSLFILTVFVVGFISCAKPSDAIYEVPKEIRINGVDYEIYSHVYYFTGNPERKSEIKFKKTEYGYDSLGIDIVPIDATFLINDEITTRSFDNVEYGSWYINAYCYQLPNWDAMTPIEIVFRFNYSGHDYKLRYSRNVCLHG